MSHPIVCSTCSTPIASLQGDKIVIESRHHGERHVTVITLAELSEKVQQAKRLESLRQVGAKVLVGEGL